MKKNGTLEIELERLYEDSIALGRSGKQIALGSLSTRNNLYAITRLLHLYNPKRTLEIGLATGGSALTFSGYHKASKSEHQGHHTAIDPFQKTVWDDAGVMALDAANLRPYCTIIEDYSSNVLPSALAERQMFDFIYVDGSHLFEDVFIDYYFSARLLSDGGVIMFDDASTDHVRKVVRFIRRNMKEYFLEIEIANELNHLTLNQKLRKWVARRLGRSQLAVFKKTSAPIRPWNSMYRSF